MFKKDSTYVLDGKILNNNDLENYIIFDKEQIEENVRKILKYDKIKGVLNDDYVLENAVILKTDNGYCLYDKNGNKKSCYYDLAYPFNGVCMLCLYDDLYGLINSEGKKILEIPQSFNEIDNVRKYIKNKSSFKSLYDDIRIDNRVGFFKDGKKIISTSYDRGYCIEDKFIMNSGSYVYFFSNDGKNLLLDNKISKICSNIIEYFDLNDICSYNDMDLLYKILLMKNIGNKGYLYDLEKDEIVLADKVLRKYKLSTDKREIELDCSKKKIMCKKIIK